MKLTQVPWTYSGPNPSPATISDMEAVFSRILGYIIGFAGIVLFLLLVSGGYKLITSGGDPGKVQTAWKTVTFAIAGFVLIIASFLILRLIYEFTGVDVTQFNVVVTP